MSFESRSKSIHKTLTMLAAFGLSVAIHQSANADPANVTRYVATTTNLEPSGLDLRFDLLKWSDLSARNAVVEALQSENVESALDNLPTVGYVWPDGSPVGYAIKYAYRRDADDAERLTFVTSRKLGSYDFGGWTVTAPAAGADLEYSVIQLESGGENSGTASLVTNVAFDEADAIVQLDITTQTPTLFTDVRHVADTY